MDSVETGYFGFLERKKQYIVVKEIKSVQKVIFSGDMYFNS